MPLNLPILAKGHFLGTKSYGDIFGPSRFGSDGGGPKALG
jgi:hypothetical protein